MNEYKFGQLLKHMIRKLEITRIITRVDDVVNSVDCQRSLCNVCCNYYFSRTGWRRVKNTGLHFWRESRINRKNDQFRYFRTQTFHSLVENFAGSVDLFLTWNDQKNMRQKQKYSVNLSSFFLGLPVIMVNRPESFQTKMPCFIMHWFWRKMNTVIIKSQNDLNCQSKYL